jgi:hypothetical protein
LPKGAGSPYVQDIPPFARYSGRTVANARHWPQ